MGNNEKCSTTATLSVQLTNQRDRLRFFFRSRGIREVEVCNKMKKSHAWISSMRVGTSADNIRKICELYPELNFQWAMTGEGHMLNNVDEVLAAMPDEIASAVNNESTTSDALVLLQRQNIMLQRALDKANNTIHALNENIARLTELNRTQSESFLALLARSSVK
jgi:hypothetical protein